MIPAAKIPWFSAWLCRHAGHRIQQTFHQVRATGLDHLRRAATEGPVVLVANHASWWDGMVIMWLSTIVLRLDAYALMDARNLRRLPFFTPAGAFGVDLDVPGDGARALDHAAALLNGPGKAVWMFPQGRERPVTVRPLGFRRGSGRLASALTHARTIPVAFRYEFGAVEKPELFIRVGAPLDPPSDVDSGVHAQEAAVTALLDDLDRALADGRAHREGEVLHQQSPSRFQAFMEWSLGKAVRHGLPPQTTQRTGALGPDADKQLPPFGATRRQDDHRS